MPTRNEWKDIALAAGITMAFFAISGLGFAGFYLTFIAEQMVQHG